MGQQWRRTGRLGAVLIAWILAQSSSAAAACPNEALRTGASAQLPDCRAYEMVTPADSNGRLFQELSPWRASYDLFGVEPVSVSGDSFVFETNGGPFSAPPGGNGQVTGDAWQAIRDAGGWRVSRHITPTGEEMVFPNAGGISFDHTYNFVFAPRRRRGLEDNGSLAADGEALYLGDPSSHFELTGVGSLGVERLAQGRYISPGGRHVIFSTGRSPGASGWCNDYEEGLCPVAKLEPNAPPAGTGVIYDREADGPTHVVSLLPGDVIATASQEAFYQGAAADGSSVAFKIGPPTAASTFAYPLYVRADNGEAGEETQAVSSEATTFGGISADGRYLYYLTGPPFTGDIHRYDSEAEEDEEVNSSGDAEIVNVSADGTHVYFISPSQLDGSEGTAGEPNLYVWSGGTPKFVATVDEADTEGSVALTNWASEVVLPKRQGDSGPGRDPSRTTPDGKVIAFESRAQLTPYDNAGHTEIYRYDDEAESIACVSCNPGQEPASADARLQSRDSIAIPPSTLIHNLSADGSRVFFESPEALLAGDQDAVRDVYEWQQALGGGEVALISSGSTTKYAEVPGVIFGPAPNLLMGVSSDGEDVFLSTVDPLLPGAPVGGAPMIYDARVNGGFPPPPPPPSPCLGEGCRPSATPPPWLRSAASADLAGSGNVVPRRRKKHHRRCRRKAGKVRRCSKPKARGSASASAGSPVSGSEEGESPLAESLAGSGAPTTTAPLLSLADPGFGIESVGADLSTEQAGDHPDFTTSLTIKPFSGLGGPRRKDLGGPRMRDLVVDLPPGLYGNPNLVPRCRTGDFLGGECPIDSQVGVSRVLLWNRENFATFPLFNLAPVHPEREVARFGLLVTKFPTFIDVSVDTAGDYGVTAAARNLNAVEPIEAVETTIWGDPADPVHDKERMTILEGYTCSTPCEAPGGERPTQELGPVAFMTNPSACQTEEVGFTVTSYQLPGQVFGKAAPLDPISGCQGLPFAPGFEAHPTSRAAGAPTGLDAVLKLPHSSDPAVPSTATMREARVTLPEGMTIAAGAADGLAACSEEQVHFHQELDAQCPDAAKLGTAEVSSPALPGPLQGAVYQRSPAPGHLFRFWLISDALGLHVKLPAEIEADPATGQLTTVFGDLPQVPVSEVALHIFGGDRAPLKNPDACGAYQTAYSFAPHSDDPAVTGNAQMTIDEGCGERGFAPRLGGGATDPRAGHFSPFVLDLLREDREQDLAGFEVTLPDGMLAKLKGVALCPDDAAPAGACPAESAIGSLVAAAGPGPAPLWIPQPGRPRPAVYLAGPYKGAPYSVVAVVPAQAGPFDLGNVVSRSALRLDPETARATVATDPLPQIIEGVPISYRRLHVLIDRPNFMLNPTDCSEQQITSTIASTQGAVAHPSVRFEVDGCRALRFKPKLSLRIKGDTRRNSHPALKATLKTRKGDANLSRTAVVLPRTFFIDQSHISNPCTRVQFAQNACPKGSILGRATASSPLLDQSLKGRVIFRSNGGERELPDVVLDLDGQVHITVVGYVDSVTKKGSDFSRLRTRFASIPDAPVSKLSLTLNGGKKGFLVLSRDICKASRRISIEMGAQNGRRVEQQLEMGTECRKEKH
jgi:hypothetical protein